MTISAAPHPAASAATDRRPAPRGDVVVEVDGVSCRVGEVTTLESASFTARRGEVIGIAGGSGAGKTTLLETIAGVRAPTRGRVIRRDRTPVGRHTPHELGIYFLQLFAVGASQ